MIAWAVIGSIATRRRYLQHDLDTSNVSLLGAMLGAATGPIGLIPLWLKTPEITNRLIVVSSIAAGLHVLKGVSFEINGRELNGLIGPNGAGKTTLTNVLDGAIKPNSGTVYLNGKRIDQLQPYDVALTGLGRTFQVTRSFRRLSVLENLYVPALDMGRPDNKAAVHAKAMEVLQFLTMEHLRNEYAQALSSGQQKLLELGGWTFRRNRKQVRHKIEANYERFPVLKEKRKQIAGELSGGQQRMVEIGRTLMSDPKMLLVDEPTAGLSKMLSDEVYEMLSHLTSRDDLTILLVEQEIRQALKIADYVYVLELGRNKFEGPADEFHDLEKAFWVA